MRQLSAKGRYRLLALYVFLQLSLYTTTYAGIAQGTSIDQGGKKVTVIADNTAMRAVLKSLEKQTGLFFFYSHDYLNDKAPVTLSMVNKTLEEVLVRLFKDLNVSWEYNDNVVQIKEKPQKRGRSSLTNVADSTITSISVTGKVTAADGTPIPGATVLVKGTNTGATTDEEGNFTLPSVKMNDVLVIKSIGYEAREIAVRGRSIRAELSLDVNDLDETVVIAYGTTTKRFNTGNVSTVKAEEIARQPVSNPLAALQGRVPGMVITQNTGAPGGSFSVLIRGRSSINLAVGNDPLYVIDGVPYISQLLENSNSFGDGGNPLNFINPADIASIDVLKDADATAIYGSRGANGVILITTKKGEAGKMKLDINLQQGVAKVGRMMDLLNTQQYLEMRREAFKNDGVLPTTSRAPDLLVWDTTRYTDWQKVLIGGSAKYTDAQASISGGSANVQYLMGGGYHRETTVFPGEFADQKASVHFNITSTSVNEKFRLSLSGNYLADKSNLPGRDIIGRIFLLEPNAPSVYNDDGSLNWENSTWSNPFSFLENKYSAHTRNLVTNAVASYRVFNSLELKVSMGYTNMDVDEISINPISAIDPAFGINTGSSYFVNNRINSWIIEPQANYKIKIGPGRLDALLGTTLQQNTNKGQYLYAEGFSSDFLLPNIQAASKITSLSTTDIQYKYNAFFGRINYNLKDKHILNLTARRDGTSRFGPDKRFHNFGAVGYAWIFSEEGFMKRLKILSYGKIRGSYGTSGNDQIGDYRYMDLYANTPYSYQGIQGIYPGNLYNPDLAWEENRKLEVGMELGLLKNRILFNTSYFRNRSSNQLVNYTLPAITGFTSIVSNLPAVVQNSGWEFVLNTTNFRTKDFQWASSFNLTLHQNKLISYPGLETSPFRLAYKVGEPLNIVQAYKSAGVNEATGVYQFSDSKGETISDPNLQTDRTELINITPKYYGGFNNGFKYKNFSLDVFMQFVKQTGLNLLYRYSVQPPGYRGNQPVEILNRWRAPGEISTIQRFTQTTGDARTAYRNYIPTSDNGYSDASFIRLKNVSLSYSLPEAFLKRFRVKSLRIYAQGQNLLTFTNDYIGYDPETQSVTVIPPLRVLTMGLQISL